jgi:hypothetical protein
MSVLGNTGISSSTGTMFNLSSNVATNNPGSASANRGQFSLAPIGGFEIDLANVTGVVLADNGSNYEANWAVYVSTDGFTSETLAGVATDPAGGGSTAFNLDLSAFQDVAGSLDFRFVPFFTTNSAEPKTSGKVLRIDNIVVNGTSEPIPEPGSLALIGLGGVMCLTRRRR